MYLSAIKGTDDDNKRAETFWEKLAFKPLDARQTSPRKAAIIQIGFEQERWKIIWLFSKQNIFVALPLHIAFNSKAVEVGGVKNQNKTRNFLKKFHFVLEWNPLCLFNRSHKKFHKNGWRGDWRGNSFIISWMDGQKWIWFDILWVANVQQSTRSKY